MLRLFALVLLILFAGNARAADPEPSIHPIFEASGAFDYCIGEQPYADGRRFTIALSPKKEVNLGLSIPKAGFKKGAHYDIALRLDEASPRMIRARALDDETLLLQMGGNVSFLDSLQGARLLSAGSGKKEIPFALPKMEAFLKTLEACVTDNRDKRYEQAAAQQSLPEEIPDSVKNLLASAGVRPISPLSTKDIPPENRPADYLWQTGNILGGIRERNAPTGSSLFDMIGLHMQGLKKKCPGSFKAEVEREQTAPGLQLRVAEASCTPPRGKGNSAILVGLVFYMMDDGMFTVVTHEGFEKEKKAIFSARDGIARAMLEAAQKRGLKKS